jgi:hypothetical protein
VPSTACIGADGPSPELPVTGRDQDIAPVRGGLTSGVTLAELITTCVQEPSACLVRPAPALGRNPFEYSSHRGGTSQGPSPDRMAMESRRVEPSPAASRRRSATVSASRGPIATSGGLARRAPDGNGRSTVVASEEGATSWPASSRRGEICRDPKPPSGARSNSRRSQPCRAPAPGSRCPCPLLAARCSLLAARGDFPQRAKLTSKSIRPPTPSGRSGSRLPCTMRMASLR